MAIQGNQTLKCFHSAMMISQMPLDVDRGIELPQLELTHKIIFCHFLKYLSEMDLWLSLRLSLTIKAHARLAKSHQLRNSSLSPSGTDM